MLGSYIQKVSGVLPIDKQAVPYFRHRGYYSDPSMDTQAVVSLNNSM